MADSPISGLPAVTSLDGTELLVNVQGGVTKQQTVQDTLNSNLPITSSGIISDFVDFNTTSSVTGKPGRLRWNDVDGTLDLTLKGGNVTLQVGQENVIYSYNNTGAPLLGTEYKAVYLSGSLGGFPSIDLADNLTRVASNNTIGIVTEDIGTGENGYVTTFGLVRDINMSTYAAGDTLYLGAADGTLRNTPPSPPSLAVIMGYVIDNSATTGSMYVNVRSGFEYPQYLVANNLTNHTASLANNETVIDFTPDLQSGISLIDSTKLTVTTPGLFEFTLDAQINRAASSGTASLYFWMKKNGVDVPNSNSNLDITGNVGTAARLLSKSLIIVLEAGDYVEFYWATSTVDMILKATVAETNPTRPATPAVKVNAARIS
ncbi:hypothetical protein N9864_00265 [bacterium]|nr:hypothetical protein [bacterium]